MLDKEIHLMKEIETVHWWFRAKDDFLLRQWPQDASGPVLDIGCGTGRFLSRLDSYLFASGKVCELHGLDSSAVSVNYAGAKAKYNIVSSSAQNTGFPDNYFSVVVASDVLEHLDDDLAGLSEIFRILKPGGYLLLTVPAYQWLFSCYDIALSHKRRYTRTMLAERLARVAFKTKSIGYYFGLLLPILILQRFLFKLLDKCLPGRSRNYTEQSVPLGLINRILFWICTFEARFMKLSFGSTVYCLARKY